ncbi:hypothetical protein MNV49_006600 [Pseudohyphozyma bogoriensis]|nr:hypothetical protein MNV49_006600 [Pseudohyphozyma bogoriensis]
MATTIETLSVNLPSQTKLDPLPVARQNAFSFAFSNPFAKGSPTIQAARKERQSHTVDLIPTNKPLFIDGNTGNQISWIKLRDDALKVASSLIHGPLALRPAPLSDSKPSVNRGAVISPLVLLHLPNCIAFTVLAYGVLASGLTVTGANPALTATEICHILQKSSPSVIVTTPQGLSTFQDAYKMLTPAEQAKLNFPSGNNVYLVDTTDGDDYGASEATLEQPARGVLGGWKVQSWKNLLAKKPAPFSPPEYKDDEATLRAAVIFWSSGTSGKSKGVVLSHTACSSALISMWYGSGIKQNERLVGLPPLYHIFGWANVLMTAPSTGATVTLVSKFEPQKYLRLVQETRATHLHIAPPVAVLLAKSPLVGNYDLSSVQNCTSGGAPLGVNVVEAVYKRLGFVIRLGYGLSETFGITNQLSDSWEAHQRLLGSVGTVFPNGEIKIVSVEDGKVVTQGQSGEILIRSPFNFTAYLNNPEATDEAFAPEQWFKTGDVGKMLGDQVFITDRLKEVIKVKGFQVSPAELEDGLCSSPLVQDAGVTSTYHDEHATEYPRAYVVPFDKEALKGGAAAEKFAHACREHIEKNYTAYKWLRGGIVIVEAVPKSPTGKLLRRLLKETKGHHISVYEEKVHKAKL